MTRRIVTFADPATRKTYKTPEFNGDRAEFIQFMGNEAACDADWGDIFKEFGNVESLKDFVEANKRAQKYYYSPYGDEVLPIEEFGCAGAGIVRKCTGKAIDLHY